MNLKSFLELKSVLRIMLFYVIVGHRAFVFLQPKVVPLKRDFYGKKTKVCAQTCSAVKVFNLMKIMTMKLANKFGNLVY